MFLKDLSKIRLLPRKPRRKLPGRSNPRNLREWLWMKRNWSSLQMTRTLSKNLLRKTAGKTKRMQRPKRLWPKTRNGMKKPRNWYAGTTASLCWMKMTEVPTILPPFETVGKPGLSLSHKVAEERGLLCYNIEECNCFSGRELPACR